MDKSEKKRDAKNGFRDTAVSVYEKCRVVFSAIGRGIHVVWNYFARVYKLILAVPVIAGALYLAKESADRLPSMVGLGLKASGEYMQVVSRNTAILGPLLLTAICLLLMFCSRRAVYPWLISVFSLVVPIVILLTNIFPA